MDLCVGQKAVVDFTIDESDMDAFARLSGDFNPLHQDDAFAKSKGFSGRVVYGALLVAKISQLIGMKLPGRDSVWSSISMQFHHPLFMGEAARAEGEITAVSAATGLVQLKLNVFREEKTLAKGKAEVLVHE